MKPRKNLLDLRLADIPSSGRLRIHFSGIVQGVGFRPYLYRAAGKFGLKGFVKNTGAGVTLEVEGDQLREFIRQIVAGAPPLSRIETLRWKRIPLRHSAKFTIQESENRGGKNVLVSPDIALCPECRKEMADPKNRRFDYPFTNCTDCGPRFTIIEGLPYDRTLTTMKKFVMCPECRREYTDPADRRYHAQPISCPECGPRLELRARGRIVRDRPLDEAVKWLRAGRVVAVKGIGGYHLACRAASPVAMARLRRFKKRARKPFALMATLAMVRRHCRVSREEKKLLQDPAAPIVLLRARPGDPLLRLAAPGQNRIGFMLPYSPLHALLMERMDEPLAMTSANLSDEPIIFRDDDRDLARLSDAILRHDRPIHSFADDSVAQVFSHAPYFFRRSRGYVPLPIDLTLSSPRPVLALGGQLKTTFTLLAGSRAFVSQHIGDTESNAALQAEKEACDHFLKLFAVRPGIVAIDRHPAYPNRLLAADFSGCRVVEVPHHQAHVASVLAENNERGTVLGVALDGTGYGDDGTVWGGEFFLGGLNGMERAGHLQPLFLPGGDAAAREPWRMALSLLSAIPGREKKAERFARPFGRKGEQVLEAIRERRGGVMTTSCGRLFDAVASLLGIGDINSYEGELPALLQVEAERAGSRKGLYPHAIESRGGMLVLNMLPAVDALLADRNGRRQKALRFHRTLAAGLLGMASAIGGKARVKKVALSGGVFQNTLLLKMTGEQLAGNGFQVLAPRQLPANDGGLSLGQAVLAAATYPKEK